MNKKLGFGFMRLPEKELEGNKTIDTEQVNKMVDTFIERGFTYFDTAYMYHNYKSEEILREALVKRYPRDKFTIATKMPLMSVKEEEDLERIFKEQLQKTGVEYFDYYLLHNVNTSSYETAKKFHAFSFIQKKKEAGLIKKIGFSFHDSADLLDEVLLANPQVDFVQLQINYLDWDNKSIQSRKCYEIADKHNKPVIVMEPIKGGSLVNIPDKAKELLKSHRPDMSIASWAIRYAASLEKVQMVLSGMSNIDQINDNVSFMEQFEPLDEDENITLAKVLNIINEAVVIPCTECLYCLEGCPKGIPIPSFFALYNVDKQAKPSGFSIQKAYYQNISKNSAKASDCIECGKCEVACPQHIKIIHWLKEVAKEFE